LAPQADTLTEGQAAALAAAVTGLYTRGVAPCVLIDAEGAAADYFVRPYAVCAGTVVPYPTLSQAADAFYCEKDRQTRLNTARRMAGQTLKNMQSRAEKKLALLLERERECEGAEALRVKGELLTSNLYRIPPKSGSVTLENYYEDNAPMTIMLDPALSPQRNAAVCFKRYTKLKKAMQYLVPQLREAREDTAYFASVRTSLSLCQTAAEVAEVVQELGLVHPKRKPAAAGKGKKVRLPPEAQPHKVEYKGFTVYYGANNLQNDRVTWKLSAGEDVWLHAKDAHGAHVLVKTAGRPLPDDVLLYAARLAARFSEHHAAPKTPVDYTQRKNVKKLSKPGLVTYTNYKTVIT
ncbi:MAG: NFACT RNA binding domain-containing protein, partial [Clostridiales bacterium]|nr:NFACT RNA binding domain-containing protein [Clostridiales bacterium]